MAAVLTTSLSGRSAVVLGLVLVEYGAYGTDACARFADVVPELRARFGDALCIVFRHRPDDPATHDAARAAEAAGAQGRFWAFHDALIRAHPAPDAPRRAAAHARLNSRRFDDERRAAWTLHRVHEDAVDLPGPDPDQVPVLFVQGRRYRGPRDTDSLATTLASLAPDSTSQNDASATTAAVPTCR